MNRKVKFLWILYGMVLAVLFLLSSTDLIIKEEAAEVYPVSVIIGDTSDENYVNFRKGMERAAIELNGDVSFITLYEKGSAVQQRELILRELADGAGIELFLQRRHGLQSLELLLQYLPFLCAALHFKAAE